MLDSDRLLSEALRLRREMPGARLMFEKVGEASVLTENGEIVLELDESTTTWVPATSSRWRYQEAQRLLDRARRRHLVLGLGALAVRLTALFLTVAAERAGARAGDLALLAVFYVADLWPSKPPRYTEILNSLPTRPAP